MPKANRYVQTRPSRLTAEYRHDRNGTERVVGGTPKAELRQACRAARHRRPSRAVQLPRAGPPVHGTGARHCRRRCDRGRHRPAAPAALAGIGHCTGCGRASWRCLRTDRLGKSTGSATVDARNDQAISGRHRRLGDAARHARLYPAQCQRRRQTIVRRHGGTVVCPRPGRPRLCDVHVRDHRCSERRHGTAVRYRTSRLRHRLR